MKIVGFACIAMIAAVSCSQNELVGENQQLITFGDAYVDNSVRSIDPSYGNETSNLVDSFQVWGTVTGNGQTVPLYEGATVSRNNAAYGAAWECDQIRYWVPGASYSFAAITGATSVGVTDGMPATISYTANGTTDLLYGTQTASTKDMEDVSTMSTVAFTMQHLLSKVKFTFTNKFEGSVDMQITDIKITNAPVSGTYTIDASEPWKVDTDTDGNNLTTLALDFGAGVALNTTDESASASVFATGAQAESLYERLVIPNTQAWGISFTLNLMKEDIDGNSQVVFTKDYELSTTDNVQLLAGYSYNFNVEISGIDDLQGIEFGVIVKDWVERTEDIEPDTDTTTDSTTN